MYLAPVVQSFERSEVQGHLDRCAECGAVFAELVKAARPAVPRGRCRARGDGGSA